MAGFEVVTEVASGDLVLPGEGQVEGEDFFRWRRRTGGRERERGRERGKEHEWMGRREGGRLSHNRRETLGTQSTNLPPELSSCPAFESVHTDKESNKTSGKKRGSGGEIKDKEDGSDPTTNCIMVPFVKNLT